MKLFRLTVFRSVMVLVVPGVVIAQCGPNVDLTWNSIDAGGGLSVAGDLALSGTIGQAEAGEMTFGDLSLTGGFRFVPSPTQAGDIDGDGDMDSVDYAAFFQCVTGPDGGSIQPGCENADLDGNRTVNLVDFGIFQAAFDRTLRPEVCWTNPAGGAWEDGNNWNAGFVPVEEHKAVIDLDGNLTVTVSSDEFVGGLSLGTDATLGITAPAPFGPPTVLTQWHTWNRARCEANTLPRDRPCVTPTQRSRDRASRRT